MGAPDFAGDRGELCVWKLDFRLSILLFFLTFGGYFFGRQCLVEMINSVSDAVQVRVGDIDLFFIILAVVIFKLTAWPRRMK